MPNVNPDIASKLNAIQAARGLTDGEFAEAMGISVRQLQRYRAGTVPNWNTVVRFARALEVQPVEFAAEEAPA